MKALENEPQIGEGIYTVIDIAQVLRLPVRKVSRWIKTYWDGNLGKEFNSQYSWTLGQIKSVNFYTLVELYIFHQLNQLGLKPRAVLQAHKILAEKFSTSSPFASQEVLNSLKTDGKKIYLEQGDQVIISLDKSNQLNLDFIKLFFRLVDFNENSLASKFWPLGKSKSIVCDPQRQFGHAVIGNTNICPDAIFSLHKAGEPVKFISSVYEISEKQVKDAIEYCMAA
ncbi:MAG: DUF433 domain-containing protein [Hymenobacter sp.]|nr:MAG: DUF433 domain-containing protein [Hymenobacter sp.]